MDDTRHRDETELGFRAANSTERPLEDQSPTTEQLRDDIDSGRTHDKVAKSDPAAAPLGTDDEASGASPTPGQVATARAHETSRGTAGQPSASRTASQTVRRPKAAMIWAIAGVVLVAIVLAFLF